MKIMERGEYNPITLKAFFGTCRICKSRLRVIDTQTQPLDERLYEKLGVTADKEIVEPGVDIKQNVHGGDYRRATFCCPVCGEEINFSIGGQLFRNFEGEKVEYKDIVANNGICEEIKGWLK